MLLLQYIYSIPEFNIFWIQNNYNLDIIKTDAEPISVERCQTAGNGEELKESYFQTDSGLSQYLFSWIKHWL